MLTIRPSPLRKAFGAHVTGVCGTTKVDLVGSIGADRVIDYTREDFADERYDLILDIGGNSRLSRLHERVLFRREKAGDDWLKSRLYP